MENSIKLEIKRLNEVVEVVDITAKQPFMTKPLLARFAQCTKDAGRGVVIKAIITTIESNYQELAKQYNDLHNEGQEGFVPDMTKNPKYREWEKVEILMA